MNYKSASIFDLVKSDLDERDRIGFATYGNRLTAGLKDGRNTLWDAYEEALDLAIYLRREIEERRIAEKVKGSGAAA